MLNWFFLACLIFQSAVSSPDHLIESKNSQELCGFCMVFWERVQQILQQNSTEIAIKNFMYDVCYSLPTNQETQSCLVVVDTELENFYIFIRSNMDPGIYCRYLKVCNDGFAPKPFSRMRETNILDKLADDKKMEPYKKHLIEKLIDHSKNVADTVECQLCTYLVSQADTLLKQNKTEQLIVDELSRICNLFSNDVKPQCQAFLQEYGPYVLILIANDITPQGACKFLRVCNSVSKLDSLKSFS